MPSSAERRRGTPTVRNDLQEPITVVPADGIGVIAGTAVGGGV